VRTSHPEQVVFPAGQVGQVSHLPNKQEQRNIIYQLNTKKGKRHMGLAWGNLLVLRANWNSICFQSLVFLMHERVIY